MKVFSVPVLIHATGYILAATAEEAREAASDAFAHPNEASVGNNTSFGEIDCSGLDFAALVRAGADVTLSPAMTFGGAGDSGLVTLDDIEEVYDDDSGAEIEWFDHDPDNDPDRAGDGWYYRFPGEATWTGPYGSEDEAEAEVAADRLDTKVKKFLAALDPRVPVDPDEATVRGSGFVFALDGDLYVYPNEEGDPKGPFDTLGEARKAQADHDRLEQFGPDDDLIGIRVEDLREGDAVDVARITLATEGAFPARDFELYECAGVEVETPQCVRVDFEGAPSIGLPKGYVVTGKRGTR